jgi:hypothetical protein
VPRERFAGQRGAQLRPFAPRASRRWRHARSAHGTPSLAFVRAQGELSPATLAPPSVLLGLEPSIHSASTGSRGMGPRRTTESGVGFSPNSAGPIQPPTPSLATPDDAGLRPNGPIVGRAALLPWHRATATEGEWFGLTIRRILLPVGSGRPYPSDGSYTDEVACLAEEVISAATSRQQRKSSQGQGDTP